MINTNEYNKLYIFIVLITYHIDKHKTVVVLYVL